MMRRIIFASLLTLFSVSSMSQTDWEFAREMRDKQLESMQSLKDALKKSKNEIEDREGKSSAILVFVSFSMPEKSIESYLRDAKKMNASVVIRGLINNSFQQTFKKMTYLVQASEGGGVELNPLWFTKFSITQVPSIVVIAPGSDCIDKDICDVNKDFDVIKGDISLYEAMRQVSDKGIANQTASKALLRTGA